MKFISLTVFFVLVSIIVLQGCDSITDSKPEAVLTPSLVSPADHDTMVVLTPTFKWTNGGDQLQISTNNTFNTLIHSANVIDSTYTIASGILQPYTYYYWRVGNSMGNSVNWSTYTFSFRTKGN